MNYWSYRVELYTLNRRRYRINKSIHKLVEQARTTGGEREAQEVRAVEGYYLDEIDHEILDLMTRYLVGKARNRFLDVPAFNEDLWEHCGFTGDYHLTDHGLRELFKVIRTDTKERTEIWTKWAAILIAVLGAVTGLVAVIKR